MATKPATTECHLMQPIAKSTKAQIEKKTSAVGRFIYTTLSSTPHGAEHTQQIRWKRISLNIYPD
jgi:hypothetical protein